MTKAFLINAHQPYSFSPGKLNQSLLDRALAFFDQRQIETITTHTAQSYDVQEEVEKHQWADVILLQSPVNWMGVPWSFKKYMDEVYSAGMDGRLCAGDGRSRKDPAKQYGQGGTLKGKKYLCSLTLNAPSEAFANQDQWFFAGKSLDDLFLPVHLNFKFFGMEPLPTFACYDVMKNPQIEQDFQRFDAHLEAHFPAA